MSGSTGSMFGRGPFGRGAYSRILQLTAGVAIRSTSRIAVGAEVLLPGVGVAIRSRSSVTVGGHKMWSLIDVPPCQPWTLLAACGCPSFVTWPQ